MADSDVALMAHLMRRAGFGASLDELEARTANGYSSTLEELLHPEEQPEVDIYDLHRYHPWTWKPGTLFRHGPCKLDLPAAQHPGAAPGEDGPLLALHLRSPASRRSTTGTR